MKVPFLSSFSVSCLCHALLIAALLWSWQPATLPSIPIPQTIQARVVSQAQMDAIAHYKNEQKKAEQERLNALKREAQRKAEAKRQAELKRLAAQQAAEAKRQEVLRIAQEKKAAEVKRQAAIKRAQEEKLAQAKRQEVLKITQEKQAAEKREQEKVAERKREQEQRIAQEREAQLQRQLEQELATLEAEHALYIDEQVAYYQSLIQNTIKRHWFVEPDMKDQSCRILLRLSNGGFIVDMQKLEGSDKICEAAQLALRKIDELPIPQDPEVFAKFREFTLTLTL